MAEALVWQLIRDNNSFLVKRGRTKRDGAVQFSSEPGNLLNVNSFKYSGIANNNVIGINQVLVKGDKHKAIPKIQLTKKSDKALNKPKATVTQTVIKTSKDLSAGVAGYRTDLTSIATLRYKKLYRGAAAKRGQTSKAKFIKSKRSLKKITAA